MNRQGRRRFWTWLVGMFGASCIPLYVAITTGDVFAWVVFGACLFLTAILAPGAWAIFQRAANHDQGAAHE